MAKAGDQYDKIALVVGILFLLAIAWLAFSGFQESKGAFGHNNAPSKEVKEIPAEATIVGASDKLNSKVVIKDHKADEKSVNLFTGANRYVKKGENGQLQDLDPEDEIHKGMKNGWFFENNVEIGWADAPERDPDGDGFSNREEYNAKSDPNDIASTPPLIDKLELLAAEAFTFELELGSLGQDSYQFRYRDSKNPRQQQRTQFIQKGDQLFDRGFFLLKGINIKKVKNNSTNAMNDVQVAMIEQLQGPQKGRVVEVPYRARPAPQFKEFTAVLTLKAIGEAGNQFKVPDNGRFSLPYKADAKEEDKKYSLKFSEDGTLKF